MPEENRARVLTGVNSTGHAVAADAILREIGPQTKRIMLVLIDLKRWTSSPPEGRWDLLRDPAFLPSGNVSELQIPELEQPIGDLKVSLGFGAGQEGERRTVSSLLSLLDWAEGRQAIMTAYAIAREALPICPDSPMLNYRAGRLARRNAYYDEAEVRFQAAIRFGLESGDWLAHALGYAGLGNTYREKEGPQNLALAERNHVLSLREARLHFLTELEGDALHDLAGISFENRNVRAGLIFARDALDTFEDDDSRIPGLANDVAWNWMHLLRTYDRAFEIFNEVSAHLTNPKDRLYLLANLARAAAGMGSKVHFMRAWSEADELRHTIPAEGTAAALLQLADGAMGLAQGDRARMAAEEAYRIAAERKEVAVQTRAENLLARLAAEPVIWSTSPGPAVPQTDPQQRATKRFGDELLDVLRRRPGVRPRWTDSPSP